MKIGGFYFQNGKEKYLPLTVDGCEKDVIDAIQLLAKCDDIFSVAEVRDDDYLKRNFCLFFSWNVFAIFN
ncbi:hypothetical protein [Chromobacterium sphagni]|uniref:hypothetical protein n=1 Tax=Chromobacterium sphagni TaxID=1903179 RepID=UPI0011146CFD|nr:hypothetical protein [Chromobacterium sphagni]